MATYNVTIQQKGAELAVLARNKYSLQVAKSIADASGKPSFNVIYASETLAPNMSVSWGVKYGLNWTTEMPGEGAKVIFEGQWTPCDLGQSFSLDNVGVWQPEAKTPNAETNALNIAKNGYSQPVHVIVGVLGEKLEWTPIWVGPNELLVGGHGEYEPLQSVQVWHQEGDKTGSMIANQATEIGQKDNMSDGRSWYFHYIVETGKWQGQDKPFDLSDSALLSGDVDAKDELVPPISIRKGVYFRNLSFGSIYI